MRRDKATNRKTVLVIEVQPLVSEILQRQNVFTEVHHPREVTGRSCSCIARKIKENQFTMVWLELPSNGRGFLEKRRLCATSEYASWLRLAHSAAVPAIIVGIRGRHWQDPNLAKLLFDKIATEHVIALCRLNIQVLPETRGASFVRFNALATQGPSRDLVTDLVCTCPEGTAHVWELERHLKGRGNLRDIATQKVYETILSEERLVFLEPNPASARASPDGLFLSDSRSRSQTMPHSSGPVGLPTAQASNPPRPYPTTKAVPTCVWVSPETNADWKRRSRRTPKSVRKRKTGPTRRSTESGGKSRTMSSSPRTTTTT